MKLNIIQKTALFWYRTFDPSGFKLNSLKTQHVSYRWLFYIGLLLTYFFTMEIASYYINLENYNLNPLFHDILLGSGKILYYLSFLCMAMIISYESIYTSDIKELIESKNKLDNERRDNKKQFWRLRNIKTYGRIFIYLFIGFIIMQLTYMVYVNFIIELHENVSYGEDGLMFAFNSSTEQAEFTKSFQFHLLVSLNSKYTREDSIN